jgi:hypothetical protein
LTKRALEILHETGDWKATLGTFIYYPSVAVAELMGFLIGWLTARKFSNFTDSQK